MRKRVIFLLVSLLAVTAPALAQRLPLRRTGINRFAAHLHVDVGLQDLFWRSHEKRLRSGFVTRVLVRVSVFAADSDQPLANAYRRSEIVYDIWDEQFRVRREDGFRHGGAIGSLGGKFREEVFHVSTEREAILLATALIKFPVAELQRLPPGRNYRIAFRADLNPLSSELVADVHRSLTAPKTGQRRLAGESFFGSFVSIFVNPRIEDSERQLRFVSQSFQEPWR